MKSLLELWWCYYFVKKFNEKDKEKTKRYAPITTVAVGNFFKLREEIAK
jgi:hypothetical protein